MYESILVGFDDSLPSKAALCEASSWAKRHGGSLSLVHAVYFDTEEFGIAPEQLEKRFKVGEKACIQMKEKTSADFGIEMQSLICEGDPPKVIVDMATDRKADLIVLGTYGRKGLNRLIMGSVTAQVIAETTSDVLVVKKACQPCNGSYKSALVPFDGSDFSKKAVNRACRLSRLDGTEVTVLYVIPRYEEMLDFYKSGSIRKSLREEAEKIIKTATDLASLQGVKIRTAISEGNSSAEIVDAAVRLKNDLIVIGSHGYRGLDKAIIGSTAERVLLHAPTPVLVVR